MAQSDYLPLIAAKVQDTAEKLTPADVLQALRAAVDEYSTARPRSRIQTITGNGVLVSHSLATDFVDGFSSIVAIEYPVDRQDPEYMDEDDYALYRDPATGVLKLRFLSLVLGNTVKAYVEYRCLHHVLATAPGGDVADSVPASDRQPVASLAAANCAVMLAAYYAQSSDTTIGADSVNYGSKSADYLELAKTLRQEYATRMGAADGVPAASAVQDLDQDLQNNMGDRFYHPRRYR